MCPRLDCPVSIIQMCIPAVLLPGTTTISTSTATPSGMLSESSSAGLPTNSLILIYSICWNLLNGSDDQILLMCIVGTISYKPIRSGKLIVFYTSSKALVMLAWMLYQFLRGELNSLTAVHFSLLVLSNSGSYFWSI